MRGAAPGEKSAADFPDSFLRGSATAAHQVEGGNTNNDWWDFEHDPTTAARDQGMTAFVTLHHFTLPRWFAARGGWLAPDATATFHRYLDGLTGPDAGDWLGVQYYRKQWVDPASPAYFAAPPAGTALTQMGWAVHPDGLRQMLHHAARTGLPLYVTENGIATTDDTERVDYLHTHLAAVAQARAEGADVRGYLHWSAFDNFEWSEGYRPRFGLIAVDRDNDFTRNPKPSAHAFARVATTGRLDALHKTP